MPTKTRKKASDLSNYEVKRRTLRFVNRFRGLVDGKAFDAMPKGKCGDSRLCPVARGVNYGINVDGTTFDITVTKRLGKTRSLQIAQALAKAGGVEDKYKNYEVADLDWGELLIVEAPDYIYEFIGRFDYHAYPDLELDR